MKHEQRPSVSFSKCARQLSQLYVTGDLRQLWFIVSHGAANQETAKQETAKQNTAKQNTAKQQTVKQDWGSLLLGILLLSSLLLGHTLHHTCLVAEAQSGIVLCWLVPLVCLQCSVSIPVCVFGLSSQFGNHSMHRSNLLQNCKRFPAFADQDAFADMQLPSAL